MQSLIDIKSELNHSKRNNVLDRNTACKLIKQPNIRNNM